MRTSGSKKVPQRDGVFEWMTGPSGARAMLALQTTFNVPLQFVHSEYAIKFTLEGRGAPLFYKGKEHMPCTSGELSIFTPYEPIVSRISMVPTSFISLLIEPETMTEAFHVLGHSGDLQINGQTCHYGDMTTALAQTTLDVSSGIPLEAISIVAIVERILDNKPDHVSLLDNHAVLRLREIILDRLAEKVSLEHAEEACGLSRFHLARMFRRHFGISPHEFHIRARIAKASSLLNKGFSPVEVAQEVGFYDQSHLNRHFGRVHGITPGAFQKKIHR